jgi:hypothetical protein
MVAGGITGVIGVIVESSLLHDNSTKPNNAVANIDFIKKVEDFRL